MRITFPGGNYTEYEYSGFKEDAIFSLMRSFKVIYNNHDKKQHLEEIILDTYEAFINANTTENDILSGREESAVGFLQRELQILQFKFKHECYATEQEYRFVFYRPRKKPDNLRNALPGIQYRNQNGVLIPYIELRIINGNDYLKEVLVSPFIKEDNAESTVKDYLMECGYDCEVRKSELPVR